MGGRMTITKIYVYSSSRLVQETQQNVVSYSQSVIIIYDIWLILNVQLLVYHSTLPSPLQVHMTEAPDTTVDQETHFVKQ